MFGIGFFEIVVIIVFALIFIGPKGLPDLMRKSGRLFVHLRRMSNDVKRQFDEVIRDAELEMEREKVDKLREMLQGKNFVGQKLQETVNLINSEGQALAPEDQTQKVNSPKGTKNEHTITGEVKVIQGDDKSNDISSDLGSHAANIAATPLAVNPENKYTFEASSLTEDKSPKELKDI